VAKSRGASNRARASTAAQRSPGSVGTPATTVVRDAGVEYRLHPYTHDPSAESYGLEAATALGVEPARVLKTLVADVDGTLCVGIVAVDRSLDLKALAAAVGGKRAAMAERAAVERATGYVLGGVSPLGQRRRLRTVLDRSAYDHRTVLVSGGRRGLDIELTPQDLARLTAAATAAIAR
jgi:Cys-tRNA(Pro)/Cys-tRNA(Cys) deacylase